MCSLLHHLYSVSNHVHTLTYFHCFNFLYIQFISAEKFLVPQKKIQWITNFNITIIIQSYFKRICIIEIHIVNINRMYVVNISEISIFSKICQISIFQQIHFRKIICNKILIESIHIKAAAVSKSPSILASFICFYLKGRYVSSIFFLINSFVLVNSKVSFIVSTSSRGRTAHGMKKRQQLLLLPD